MRIDRSPYHRPGEPRGHSYSSVGTTYPPASVPEEVLEVRPSPDGSLTLPWTGSCTKHAAIMHHRSARNTCSQYYCTCTRQTVLRGTNDLSLCMHKLPLPAVDGRKSMLPWLFAVICFAIPDLAPIRAGEEFQALLPPSHISQLCPLSV